MDSDTIQDIDSTIFDLLRTAIEEVVNHYSVNADDLDGSRNLIDLVQELLELYGFIIGVEGQENDVYVAVRDLVTALITDVEHRCMKRRRGRPEISIEEDQLRFLIEQGFTVQDVSRMFQCSRRTIERRMSRYQISYNRFSTLNDDELDSLTSEIAALFPRCGTSMMLGRLRSCGIVIQRERIRESLRRVDPTGVIARTRNCLHRRVYSVPCANALWAHRWPS